MFKHLHKVTGVMKTQGNMTPPKEHNRPSVTDLNKWRYRNHVTKNSK